MSAVNLWKPQKLQSRMQFTELSCKWRFVRIAENRALPASLLRILEFGLLSSTYFPHVSQAFSTGHAHVIVGESCTTIAERKREAQAGGAACVFGVRKEGKASGYCNASIRRVMVRFRSLSDRRNSSILLIECNTVVWCLPPNCRPISGSEAVVSCLTMYIAT